MSLIGQLFFDGIASGLIFVILAAGLVFILSVSRIFFIAYGQFYMIGAYTVWFVISQFHLPYFLALMVGVLVTAILGVLSYVLIFQRMQGSEGRFLLTITAALGLSIIIGQAAILLFGTIPRSIPTVFTGSVNILGINIAMHKLMLVAMGIAVTLILYYVYEKTNIGRAMRAVSFLPDIAALQGINHNFINQVTFGLATAIAGLAGGIIAPSYGMSPTMGNSVILSVLLLVMLGGMDSFLGAVVGGLIVGEILSFGQFFIGGMVELILFLIIGIVLYFRPQGLLGRQTELEN